MAGQGRDVLPVVVESSSTPVVLACPKCGGDHEKRCTGHVKRDGNRACRRWPIAGLTVCMMHGGRTKQAVAAGQRRIAATAVQNVAGIYGIPRRVDPAQGLIEEYWRTAGIIHGLEPIVAGLTREQLTLGMESVTETASAPNWGTDAEGNPNITIESGGVKVDVPERALTPSERRTVTKAGPAVLVRLLNEERDRFARLGVDIVKLGLEAQRDAYVREQAAMLADVLGQLNLTKAQRAQARDLLRELDQRTGGR